ncbi:MAG: lipid IV(A) 3-deoxy-D-manno-octulosonic acid transferase [Proteobacteria bacterium]|nr:lipid IV(A) 3-deoxy-D-manno-octulosonic acid transferase [Pseudomonadota bacterium]
MARRLYTLLVLLALPLASLVVLWRGFRDRDYWRGWRERFGCGAPLEGEQRGLWLHAVSVGEVQAAASLVAALRREWPELPLAVTSATPAGRSRARAAFESGVDARYAPYDLPWCVRAALRRLRPTLLVVMETELWPNLLDECDRAGVGVLIVSARLSARSRARWSRFNTLLQPALGRRVLIAAQSAADAERFISLGAPAARVRVCGNIKFDREPRPGVVSGGVALRARYAAARPLWVAGSTHAGEEQAALAAHAALRTAWPQALLVLAPRHRPRFDEVARLLDERSLRWLRHSAALADPAGTSVAAAQIDVLLLDTIGELEDFYAAADVAFVGGSLVPVGGHNLLEPAALGVATLAGPAQGNAPDVARLLQQNGGLQLVRDAAELGAAVQVLLADSPARARMGKAAQATVAANRGALDQALVMIRECLAKPASR